LRMEIAGTDSLDFRIGLKERKQALLEVLAALPGVAAQSPTHSL